MKAKVGKIEARAIEACEYIRQNGVLHFNMEWRKSRYWGRCPVIEWHGYKAAGASGCGYDKGSAALSSFLNPLSPGLNRCSGAGFSTVRDTLAESGWNLEQTFSGKTEDGFKISKKAN